MKRKKERHNERNDGNEFVCVQDESRRGAEIRERAVCKMRVGGELK